MKKIQLRNYKELVDAERKREGDLSTGETAQRLHLTVKTNMQHPKLLMQMELDSIMLVQQVMLENVVLVIKLNKEMLRIYYGIAKDE